MANIMKWVLIGAGGHARAIFEGMRESGQDLNAYVDSIDCPWLPEVRRYDDDACVDVEGISIVMGIGGQTPRQLRHRYKLVNGYLLRGATAQLIVHPTAIISPSARLALGTIVLAGAIVQPNVSIGPGVIVNTGAIVEHDSVIGAGSHIGPGAVVLGNCTVGECCMIGAGAVLLPQTSVLDETIVKAGSVFSH